MDKDQLHLREIEDMQPDPHPRRRQDERNWFAKNWLGVATLGSWIVMQVWSGGSWFGSSAANNAEIQRQVNQIQKDLNEARNIYVRQDVFNVTLESINQRLASIDRKVSDKR